MATEEFVLSVIDECNKERNKTFAEFIATVFKDKFVEIYLGDAYEDVSTEQVSTPYPAVFCGKIIGAYRECIILNSAYFNKSNELTLGNMVFISERAVRGMTEIDGNGTMEDMFLRSGESLQIKKVLVDRK